MKVISLFSGAGGLDLGFIKAGHEIVFANDINKSYCDTYRHNIGEIFCGDVAKLKPSEIPDGDIVIGGWPCQGFTIANVSRTVDDSRNKLYLEMKEIIKAKRPKFFLAENVPGILSLANGKVIKKIVNDFEEAGYVVYSPRKINFADYGVPQKRQRVIIFGKRKDVKFDLGAEFPEPTHDKSPEKQSETRKWTTLKDAIKDLPEPPKPEKNKKTSKKKKESNIKNHVYSQHKVRINGYVGHRKLNWNEPSPTITGRGEGGGGPVIHPHPNLKRRLTVRECARIQTFPDDFEFMGSMTSQYGQIGNAVPPLGAYYLARMFPKKIN